MSGQVGGKFGYFEKEAVGPQVVLLAMIFMRYSHLTDILTPSAAGFLVNITVKSI